MLVLNQYCILTNRGTRVVNCSSHVIADVATVVAWIQQIVSFWGLNGTPTLHQNRLQPLAFLTLKKKKEKKKAR